MGEIKRENPGNCNCTYVNRDAALLPFHDLIILRARQRTLS
jgi:hypothetical protein